LPRHYHTSMAQHNDTAPALSHYHTSMARHNNTAYHYHTITPPWHSKMTLPQHYHTITGICHGISILPSIHPYFLLSFSFSIVLDTFVFCVSSNISTLLLNVYLDSPLYCFICINIAIVIIQSSYNILYCIHYNISVTCFLKWNMHVINRMVAVIVTSYHQNCRNLNLLRQREIKQSLTSSNSLLPTRNNFPAAILYNDQLSSSVKQINSIWNRNKWIVFNRVILFVLVTV